MNQKPKRHKSNSIDSNSFAQDASYRQIIKKAFESNIFPPRKGENLRIFDESNLAVHYESQRRWVDRVQTWPSMEQAKKNQQYRHEKYIDYLFWSPDIENPVICILGEVGSGKSTLIDYYLRCHCPSRGNFRDEFEQKLVINFDCRADPSSSDLKKAFFHSAQDDISIQCQARNYEIESEIRRMGYAPRDIQDWVWMALKKLSISSKDPNSPFEYIVVVIDNLDQCTLDVQKSMIATIEHYIADATIDVWRFFLPLWPGTYKRLKSSDINLLKGSSDFSIGKIQTYDLLQSRNQSINRFPGVEKLPDLRSADSGSLLTGNQHKNFILSTLQHYRRNFGELLDGLTNGNLRRLLAITGESLNGNRAYQVWSWRSDTMRSTQREYRYDSLVSLLCGEHKYLHHNLNRIANVFDIGSPGDHREILSGFQSIWNLYSLGPDEEIHKNQFLETIVSLGYNKQLAINIYMDLFKLGLFHEEPNGTEIDNPVVVVHSKPCEAYARLVPQPEYLVSVAQVSLVDQEACNEMDAIQSSYRNEFLAEAFKSIEFIRCVQRIEQEPPNSPSTGATSTVPVLWRMFAHSYYLRLKNLRASGALYGISSTDWIQLLNDQIFSKLHH